MEVWLIATPFCAASPVRVASSNALHIAAGAVRVHALHEDRDKYATAWNVFFNTPNELIVRQANKTSGTLGVIRLVTQGDLLECGRDIYSLTNEKETHTVKPYEQTTSCYKPHL